MKSFLEFPEIYLAGASLHIFIGNLFSSFIYKWRFGQSPQRLHRGKARSLHMVYTQAVGISATGWALSLVLTAYSVFFRESIFGSPIVELNPVFGWAMGLGGLALMVAVQFQMGKAFRIGQEVDVNRENSILIQTGIYQWSRNPIYLFSFSSLAGFTLWNISISTICSLLAIGYFIHQLVLEEEKFLKKRFGNRYENYIATVPRYFGMPRKLAKI